MDHLELTDLKGKLIYFGDPMCSWCWGIIKNLDRLKKRFNGVLGFELVMGGLRPGGGDHWDKAMKEFLRNHWQHVHAASGQPFNYDLLSRETFNYDTEPPSRAVVLVRDMKPDVEFDFFKSIQEHFYLGNGNPNLLDFYKPICDQFGISFDAFSTAFESDVYKEKVKEDFLKSRQYGIRGFPSVVFQGFEQVVLITHGFATSDQMAERVLTHLN